MKLSTINPKAKRLLAKSLNCRFKKLSIVCIKKKTRSCNEISDFSCLLKVIKEMSSGSKVCGVSLRIGVIVLALLDVIIALVYITCCSIRLAGNQYDSNTIDSSTVAYKSADIVGIVLYTMVSFTAIVLIVGAAKNMTSALKPWMLTKLSLIVCTSILQIAYLCLLAFQFHTKAARFVVLMESATIIQIGKTGFFSGLFLLIRSLLSVFGCYTVFLVTNYYNLLTKPKEENQLTTHRKPSISVIWTRYFRQIKIIPDFSLKIFILLRLISLTLRSNVCAV